MKCWVSLEFQSVHTGWIINYLWCTCFFWNSAQPNLQTGAQYAPYSKKNEEIVNLIAMNSVEKRVARSNIFATSTKMPDGCEKKLGWKGGRGGRMEGEQIGVGFRCWQRVGIGV